MARLTTLKSPLQTIRPRLHPQQATTQRLRGRAAMSRAERIKLRDLYTCQECGRVTRALDVDHRIPLWQGGPDDDTNLWCLCHNCHAAKTAREAGERANQLGLGEGAISAAARHGNRLFPHVQKISGS